MKHIDQHFADWESHVFGFGYGSGEEHILAALKKFMAAVGEGRDNPRTYNYELLEKVLTPTVAWLLINALCHADILEYGTSPRFGWLSPEGERLRDYLEGKTVEQLEALCCCDDSDFAKTGHPCYPDHCNCAGGPCSNPFWPKKKGA